ncbi:mitochondrial carrier domain-containing protein, partial [Gigaspora rosea]
ELSNVSTVLTEILQMNDSQKILSSTTVTASIKKTATKDTIACAAVTFSNPWEVVKTRLQLQAFYYIIRHEGLFSINKGLGPAYVYQIVINDSCLGLYDPIKNSLVSTFGTSNTSLPISIISGGLSGIIAAFLCSPFNLVKTHIQAFSTHMPIGHQHAYKNTFSALNQIWKSNGLKGLFTGVNAAIYFYIKRWIIQKTGMNDNDILLHSLTSMISGLCVCTTMNPFDVISTRMFNQKKDINGKGSLYNNTFDCFIKTIKLKVPHTILTLVFLEQFRGLYIKYTR